MQETISNWGELCAAAGIEAGDTATDASVERLATGGNVVGARNDIDDAVMDDRLCLARVLRA